MRRHTAGMKEYENGFVFSEHTGFRTGVRNCLDRDDRDDGITSAEISEQHPADVCAAGDDVFRFRLFRRRRYDPCHDQRAAVKTVQIKNLRRGQTCMTEVFLFSRF